MSERRPSAAERAGEKAFARTTAADIGITLAIFIVAVLSGSLTMLSETLRAVLLLSVQVYTLWLLFGVHRGRFKRFEYGIAKLERFIFVVVGVGLVFGALWVGRSVLDAFAGEGPPASPLGLAFAAIINAVNLGINFIGWHAIHSATRGRDPGLLAGELSAKFGALVGSVILQITLTLAALAKDPATVLALDALGATLVALLMAKRGLKMIFAGLNSLLDQPPGRALAEAIRAAVLSAIPAGDISGMRMRMAGGVVFVDVAVESAAFGTVGHLAERIEAVREALADLPSPVDLTVAPRPPGGEGG